MDALPASTENQNRTGWARARVVLKPRKAQPFYGRHPWVFEGAIQYVEGECAEGDVVDLFTDRGKFVARGMINTRSKLVVRLYTWDQSEALDEAFWKKTIARALEARQRFALSKPEGAARLVYSEADGLSGLIADQYAGHLVVQLNSLAMSNCWPLLQPHFVELAAPHSIILRSDRSIAEQEGMEPRSGVVWGNAPDGPVTVIEHGLKYAVDLQHSQKTGLYLDQAENHRIAAQYMAGRRVLDLFCYTGGFSLAAARLGGALQIRGVDSSERAIVAARANASANGVENVQFETGDCFETLDQLRGTSERFDAVILDPPKFARKRGQVDEALRAYHRINRLAVDLLTPGGVLVTCSCSGGVTREDFLLMLSGVAQKSGRDIQILQQCGASADHPVQATCLETEYLKCFICRVV